MVPPRGRPGCCPNFKLTHSNSTVNEINEALGRNFATPEDLDEADLDAELEMLGDELEEELVEDEATPSYLLPSNVPDVAPGNKEEPQALDEFGLPAAPTQH